MVEELELAYQHLMVVHLSCNCRPNMEVLWWFKDDPSSSGVKDQTVLQKLQVEQDFTVIR